MRKLVLLFTFLFLSTILLRYTVTSACWDNQIKQDNLNNYEHIKKLWNSSQNKNDNPLDNDKKDSSKKKNIDSPMDYEKKDTFINCFDECSPQSPQDYYNFSKPSSCNMRQNPMESCDNKSSSSKVSDIKEELGKTKEMLNMIEDKAKDQIDIEIKKSKSLLDKVIKDEDLDLDKKEEKISEIKRKLNKKIKKIEADVIKQVKSIVELQYEKADNILDNDKPN